MRGRLYVIGVGPGDPELITLKAKRILESVRFIFFPKGHEEGHSLARAIVEPIVDLTKKDVVELHFPMLKKGERDSEERLREKWSDASHRIIGILKDGMDVAFLTLGDPGLYSTYFNLLPHLKELMPDLNMEIIPGISSVSLAFSKLGLPMAIGEESIVILPATYLNTIEEYLENFSTVILMKVHKVFEECLSLARKRRDSFRAYYVARLGMKGEKMIQDLEAVKEDDLNYFSMVIFKRR